MSAVKDGIWERLVSWSSNLLDQPSRELSSQGDRGFFYIEAIAFPRLKSKVSKLQENNHCKIEYECEYGYEYELCFGHFAFWSCRIEIEGDKWGEEKLFALLKQLHSQGSK